jgi:predicted nucleic acid-binding Zn ribbon protein
MSDETTDAFADLEKRQGRERARFKARSPKPMAGVIGQLMARRDYARVISSESLELSWREAAGQALARFTRVGRLRRGVLEVVVANSTMMQELAFRKSQLLAQLRRLEPDQKIRDLRFRLGTLD